MSSGSSALATLLVAVEQVDGEWPTLGEGVQEAGSERIVWVADGAFPVSGPARRDVEIDREPPEPVCVGVGVVGEGPIGRRHPPVQQCDPGAYVAHGQGQVDDPTVCFGDGSSAAEPNGVLIAPQDLVDRVVGQGKDEQGAHPGEQRVLGNARRAIR